MLQQLTFALVLSSSLSASARSPVVVEAQSDARAADEGLERGALALRQCVGSRVVVDSASDLGIEVVGRIEDLLLDIETGLVTRVIVRDVATAEAPVAREGEGLPLRLVSLDSLTLAASGGRAIATFAYTAEDYRSLPIYDAEHVQRPADGDEARLFSASELRRVTAQSRDGVELGAVRDLWVDLRTKRIDFIEHALEDGHAGAPWSAVEWTRADGKLTAAKITRDAALVRSVPRVNVQKKHTLSHRDYRELVRAAYGVKKEPDTAGSARR